MIMGVIPIIRQDAIMFHSANLSDDEDSIVNIDRPNNAPAPMNTIMNRSNHQGTPRFLVGEMERNACTMFSLLVHKAVTHNVIIAITKPSDIPINTLSKLNEYAMPSAPALADGGGTAGGSIPD